MLFRSRNWNHITTPAVRVGTRLRIRDRDDDPTAEATSAQVKPDTDSDKPRLVLAETQPPVDQPVLDKPAGGMKKGAADRVPAKRTHTVKSGETLTDIARAHNVSADALRKLNNLRGGHITPGQKLLLPT